MRCSCGEKIEQIIQIPVFRGDVDGRPDSDKIEWFIP